MDIQATTTSGTPLDELSKLAPGVLGYIIEKDGAFYIPVIVAEKPGNGDVKRYLDELPRNQTIRFPCVISAKLAGMLARRGFVETSEWVEEFSEAVDVWERKPAAMEGA